MHQYRSSSELDCVDELDVTVLLVDDDWPNEDINDEILELIEEDTETKQACNNRLLDNMATVLMSERDIK